jgi:hypothetical protein
MTFELPDLNTERGRRAIADAVERHLDALEMSRKQLIRSNLSESTINKFFQGDFSDRTLAKIEAILGKAFKGGGAGDNASEELGGYSFRSVEELPGTYLCVRPLFSDPTLLNAYIVDISWDHPGRCLIFRESGRADKKHMHSGVIYNPAKTPFLYLMTISSGEVRTILLTTPGDDGLALGLILAVHNPKGTTYLPVAAPIFLKRLSAGENPELGFITPQNASYVSYHEILASVESDGFGHLVSPARSST